LNDAFGGEGWWNTNEEEEPNMSQDDANKIIRFLPARAWLQAARLFNNSTERNGAQK
jgi:hypothetical protein